MLAVVQEQLGDLKTKRHPNILIALSSTTNAPNSLITMFVLKKKESKSTFAVKDNEDIEVIVSKHKLCINFVYGTCISHFSLIFFLNRPLQHFTFFQKTLEALDLRLKLSDALILQYPCF